MPQFGEIMPPNSMQTESYNTHLELDRTIGSSRRLPLIDGEELHKQQAVLFLIC